LDKKQPDSEHGIIAAPGLKNLELLEDLASEKFTSLAASKKNMEKHGRLRYQKHNLDVVTLSDSLYGLIFCCSSKFFKDPFGSSQLCKRSSLNQNKQVSLRVFGTFIGTIS
jgi:hypothetical protein